MSRTIRKAKPVEQPDEIPQGEHWCCYCGQAADGVHYGKRICGFCRGTLAWRGFLHPSRAGHQSTGINLVVEVDGSLREVHLTLREFWDFLDRYFKPSGLDKAVLEKLKAKAR